MSLSARARACIQELELVPHPEGGYFREFFRSSAFVAPADGRGARAALTAIHFLLPEGAHSRWHEVRSDEQWTFLEGEPLELFVLAHGQHAVQRLRLGPLAAGCVQSVVVPAGAWQAARAGAGHTLVTCTVGPGFDFADFLMLADSPAARARIAAAAPELASLL